MATTTRRSFSTMEFSDERAFFEKTGCFLLDQSTQETCESSWYDQPDDTSFQPDNLLEEKEEPSCSLHRSEEDLFELSQLSIFLPHGDSSNHSQLEEEDEIDAFATFNSKIADAQHPGSHELENIAACALIRKDEETRLQDLQRPSARLSKFVEARAETFSNNMDAIRSVDRRLSTLAHNIDVAQAHAECVTRSIAKGAALRTMEDIDPSLLLEEEESRVADFVLSRVRTLARNIDFAQERTEAMARGLGNFLQRRRSREEAKEDSSVVVEELKETIEKQAVEIERLKKQLKQSPA